MSLAGKVAVVFGASGYVGSGAVHAFLEAGATVVAVGREAAKLAALQAKLSINVAALHTLVGETKDEETTKHLHENLNKLLNGKAIDHIVVSVGFVYAPSGGVTSGTLKDLHIALDEGLPQTFLIAREFLPVLKNREGSTFTTVSGGTAHFCPEPFFWAATLKNAALNALTLGLAAEAKNDKVRVNNLCIFFGVSPLGGTTNQLGWPGVNTTKTGKLFISLTKGTKRGEIVDVKDEKHVEELEKTLAQ